MTSLSIADARIFVGRRCATGVAAVLSLVVVADWLFYRQQIGISSALFIVCLAAGVVAANPVRANRRTILFATALLVAALIPLVFRISFGALLLGAIGIAVFAVMMVRPAAHWIFTIAESALVLFGCAWRAAADLSHVRNLSIAGARALGYRDALAKWILPLALGALFLLLFTAANPLIEDWLVKLNPWDSVSVISPIRIVFWLATLSVAWSFVFIFRRHVLPLQTKTELQTTIDRICSIEFAPQLINHASILRSLVLFNALFAVQTLLDLTYLWSGASLPAGMNYAAYAHRGAYPLVIAALLAAAFVLVAMRPGSDSERSPLIRKLVYLWTAQTLLLVVSSILRLDLYVEAYSLTYLRVAAFVWMVLVAVGLVLMAARIALGRSNLWLITGNAIALALAIYAASIVNLPGLIAQYNVEYSRELSGKGVPLDVNYIGSLGPQAIPALDLYLARWKGWGEPNLARQWRDKLAARHPVTDLGYDRNWRAWTLWDWRLSQYLEAHAATPPAP